MREVSTAAGVVESRYKTTKRMFCSKDVLWKKASQSPNDVLLGSNNPLGESFQQAISGFRYISALGSALALDRAPEYFVPIVDDRYRYVATEMPNHSSTLSEVLFLRDFRLLLSRRPIPLYKRLVLFPHTHPFNPSPTTTI